MTDETLRAALARVISDWDLEDFDADNEREIVEDLVRAALASPPATALDVERLARALALESLGDASAAFRSDGTPYPADIEWAARIAEQYARLAGDPEP